MTGRCATCAHWSTERQSLADLGFVDWSADDDAPNGANHEDDDSGMRKCLAVPHVDATEARTALAVVSDSDRYAARLLVRGDFGCVQWKATP